MKLVIIESPYAGTSWQIRENTAYARNAMRDSLERGEAPIASHLLYTQPYILDENNKEEREWGIAAGLAWRKVADFAAFYVDRGWSPGMLAARRVYDDDGRKYVVRRIEGSGEGGG